MVLASPEFIMKLIIGTNTLLTSSSIWMISNWSRDFSNTGWSLELFLFSVLFELGSDIWVLLLSALLFHCPLPGFHPIGWLRALLHSLVSILFHSLRLLGVSRKGKFLVLASAYPWVQASSKENAGFDCQSCDHFSTSFRASKNPTFRWAIIWLISSCFLITGHCSLFALWLLSQFRHFLTQDPSCSAFPHEKHCFSFVQHLLMWPNFRGDPLRWPRDTLYQQKLALIMPTCGGRSVGTVRLWTKATEFSFSLNA
jgi:hypothetical protein